MMVVVGLMVFFGVAVVGPIAGNATGFAARTLLGKSDSDQSRNQARAVHPDYKASAGKSEKLPELLVWANCCEDAGAKWDYESGKCNITTQVQADTLSQCSPSK